MTSLIMEGWLLLLLLLNLDWDAIGGNAGYECLC